MSSCTYYVFSEQEFRECDSVFDTSEFKTYIYIRRTCLLRVFTAELLLHRSGNFKEELVYQKLRQVGKCCNRYIFAIFWTIYFLWTIFSGKLQVSLFFLSQFFFVSSYKLLYFLFYRFYLAFFLSREDSLIRIGLLIGGLCITDSIDSYFILVRTVTLLSKLLDCVRINSISDVLHAGKKLGFAVQGEVGAMSGGLVRQYSHSVLPTIKPIHTFLVTLFAMMVGFLS